MKNITHILQKVKLRLKNKYIIILVAFGIYFCFFDTFSLSSRIANSRKINTLNKEIAYYENETKQTQAQIDELCSNNQNLVKFAREKYLMKKPNEDIFIVNEE